MLFEVSLLFITEYQVSARSFGNRTTRLLNGNIRKKMRVQSEQRMVISSSFSTHLF